VRRYTPIYYEVLIMTDKVLQSLLDAEDKAFNAMGKSFRKYEPIYEMIKSCRKSVEDIVYPSENMVDIEALVLRNEGNDKQEVRE
jgi:hypothetical protein